jgi:hypothetical protein
VPSSDEASSPGDIGESDYDGLVKKKIKLTSGRKRKLKNRNKRV